MSEFSSSISSSSSPVNLLLLQFVSHLISLSYFIISHPLYFFYFIFFSPYLFKILSFLSPLFITTSLLILALITTFAKMDSPEPNLNFVVNIYHRLLDSLHPTIEDDLCLEGLEAYKIVFETSIFEIGDNPDEFLKVEDKEVCFTTSEDKIDRCSSSDSFGTGVSEVLNDELEEYQFEITEPEIKKLECLLQVNGDLEKAKISVDKVTDEIPQRVRANVMSSDSSELDHADYYNSVNNSPNRANFGNLLQVNEESGGLEKAKISVDKVNDEIPQRVRASVMSTDSSELDYADYYNSANNSPNRANFGNFGSMRKEKEWRRTLACKLFEERHNHNINVNNGNEAMDSLWETYEADNSNLQQSKSTKSESKKSKSKSSRWNKELYDDHDHRVRDELDEDEDGEIYNEGSFCCLQALKFSAGKMNLGMKKPNLVKISKAIKGIGWLHHVSRHGKKVYP